MKRVCFYELESDFTEDPIIIDKKTWFKGYVIHQFKDKYDVLCVNGVLKPVLVERCEEDQYRKNCSFVAVCDQEELFNSETITYPLDWSEVTFKLYGKSLDSLEDLRAKLPIKKAWLSRYKKLPYYTINFENFRKFCQTYHVEFVSKKDFELYYLDSIETE